LKAQKGKITLVAFEEFWFSAVLRIRDVYPGSRILISTHPGSRIPDPKTATKERGEKKVGCLTIFCSHKFHKIKNYFIFDMLKKIMWANFQRIIEFFTQKIVNKLSKIWAWDPGSGKPGSRSQKGTGSRIRIRNTGSSLFLLRFMKFLY
jgi:hypothetical protein